MRRHGMLWMMALLATCRLSLGVALAREVTVETRFDDAAAYPPLRLIDERLENPSFDHDGFEPFRDVREVPVFDDESEHQFSESFGVQVLPKGLLYRSYIAGEKEPRFNAVWLKERGRGLVWETQMGGRIGLLGRSNHDEANPRAWQFDMEGGAQARVDPQQNSDLEAVDFRFGLLFTRRNGPNAYKAGYYHLSSHIGDEYLLRNPGYLRLNYVRDSLIFGITRNLSDNMQLYGEVGYAVGYEGGAEPLELQYGYQYTPLRAYGLKGAPYFGINGHTRQDFQWITSVNTVAGWQWRGEESNHLFRVGFQYYTGPALQWQFAGRNETLCGAGMWFDY
ncbi:MAG: DUF1207 domain-containing protein [Planctomycetes bacterium]|nr:DUF1207 domain-containing protein [Planctomycetota bacterium]